MIIELDNNFKSKAAYELWEQGIWYRIFCVLTRNVYCIKTIPNEGFGFFPSIEAAQSTWGFNKEDHVGSNKLYNTGLKWELMEVVGNLAHIES